MGNRPVVVVSPRFCSPYKMDLTIVRKFFAEDYFAITDINGNVMFRIKAKIFSRRERRILLDSAGNPLLTIKRKLKIWSERWQVFRGESTDPKDLLFSVKRFSAIPTKLDVFLAANTQETVCDFKLKGNWFGGAYTVYLGNTTTIIAKMHRKHSVESVVLGRHTFALTVNPKVDYAFIVALVVVLQRINES